MVASGCICLRCVLWLLVYWSMHSYFFFFKQKTAYEMRISDWSSDVCSSDLDRRAAGSVGNHVDFIAAFQRGAQREGGVADFRPQARNDDLLAAAGGQRVAHILVVPGVHRGALEDLVLGEDLQQFGIGMAREALGLDRGDGGGDIERLGGLGQADHVVLQDLAVDRLHAEGHLRLLVDEDDLAVLRSQDFKILRHGNAPINNGGTEGAAACPMAPPRRENDQPAAPTRISSASWLAVTRIVSSPWIAAPSRACSATPLTSTAPRAGTR